MDKAKFLNGLFVMVGLIVLGLMIPRAVVKNRSFDRTVNVKGLCEKEVMADKVIWPIVYKVMADDIQSIYDQMDANDAKIKSFLTEGGISEDEITVSVPDISDKLADEYGSISRAFRYISTGVVTVCTENVEIVLELMSRQSDLMRQGVTTTANSWENAVEFKYEGLNEIKPIMIEEATRNAREAAEKFAKDSDSKLGKIKTANQGVFSISARDSNTPYIKNIRVVTSVTYYLNN